MISVHTFFSGTLTTVDTVVSHFVNQVYTHLIQANFTVITVLFTLYIMFLGYRFMLHKANADLGNIIRHLIVMLCVYGLITSWNLYDLLVYSIFTNEPGHIAQIIVDSASKSGGLSVAEVLDGIFESVIHATMEFFGQVNFSVTGIAFIFYGALVFLIGSVMCVFALLLFIYAKMMMAVALGLGPIFILFILWEPTKGLFSSWLSKLITLALIPIVTTAILMLMLSVIDVTLPGITQTSDSLQFYGIAPFLGLSLATAIILSQVLNICSSLGGGLTMMRLSEGLNIANQAYEKAGLKSLSQAAYRYVSNSKTNRFTRKSRQ